MRSANFQTIAWFWDLYQRGMLDLDPSYQRRSVWNQPYKELFVDTVLNGFPAPAIFLYQEISPEGSAKYSVVDGKQRLSTLFEFAQNRFPVSDNATINSIRGRYFKDLDDDFKKNYWGYQFSVEYLPSSDEKIINTIFDRINRNVAKLTPQELRHAKFDGEFITTVEELNEWMSNILPVNFPVINQRSKKQMKDIEFTSQLVLFLEEGIKSYSQIDLDKSYAERDEIWENKDEISTEFKYNIECINKILCSDTENRLAKSRLKNQSDFYSLFVAVVELNRNEKMEDIYDTRDRLIKFINLLDNEDERKFNTDIQTYYEAARSASNDPGPRKTRAQIVRNIILDIIHL